MSTWTGLAEVLADDIREPGFGAAVLCATAWCARVDPDATHGLVGAAMALTDGDALSLLWHDMPPCPDDAALLSSTEELQGDIAGHMGALGRLVAACGQEHEAAASAYVVAAKEADAAKARAASASTEQARNAARAEYEAAAARANAAAVVAADCETALGILHGAGGKLEHAMNCLRRVPDDLAGTYEEPYQLVHDGGKLPYDGDFLTGGISYEAAR